MRVSVKPHSHLCPLSPMAWGLKSSSNLLARRTNHCRNLVPFQGADRVYARFFDTRKLAINDLSSVVLRARSPGIGSYERCRPSSPPNTRHRSRISGHVCGLPAAARVLGLVPFSCLMNLCLPRLDVTLSALTCVIGDCGSLFQVPSAPPHRLRLRNNVGCPAFCLLFLHRTRLLHEAEADHLKRM